MFHLRKTISVIRIPSQMEFVFLHFNLNIEILLTGILDALHISKNKPTISWGGVVQISHKHSLHASPMVWEDKGNACPPTPTPGICVAIITVTWRPSLVTTHSSFFREMKEEEKQTESEESGLSKWKASNSLSYFLWRFKGRCEFQISPRTLLLPWTTLPHTA